MLYLRNMVDNHRILTAILVIYFCLFLGLHQAVAIFWKLIGAALGVIALVQLIRATIKSLDEKINDTQKKIAKLSRLRNKAYREYERLEVVRKQRQRDVAAARRAYTAAVTAYNNAVTAEKAAGAAYRSAKSNAATAKRDYQTHVRWCSTCAGSALCPIGSDLNDLWQFWERTKKDAKVTWDNAKAQVKSTKKAKEDASDALFTARVHLGIATRRANAALAQWRALGKEIKRLAAELASLRVAKALQEAELAKALGDLAKARRKLDEAERDYPDQWRESMEDPDFRQSVEDIRNYSAD